MVNVLHDSLVYQVTSYNSTIITLFQEYRNADE